MASHKPIGFTTLRVLACAIVMGGPVCLQAFGKEVLPTMRKPPRSTTVWVGDDAPSRPASPLPQKKVAVSTKATPAPPKPMSPSPKAIDRQPVSPAKAALAPGMRAGVVAVSDDRPVVKDRRAATLQALADGFRQQRIEPASAPEIVESRIAEPSPSLPAVYAAPIGDEPAPQVAPAREFPAPVAEPVRPISAGAADANLPILQPLQEIVPAYTPVREIPQSVIPARSTNAAAVEANMPATLELLPSPSPESASHSNARFVSTEEPRPRSDSWQTRMNTNPLRRAADTLSARRNPLRGAE